MRRSLNAALLVGFTSLALIALTAPSALPQDKKSASDQDSNAIGKRNISGKVNFFSIEKETAHGKLLALEVERSSKLIDDPAATEYLSRLARNLAKNSDAKFPITIRLIDSHEINAFTLPGGYQYVNRGLILATESEAELAGVLAHGIAHTALRGSTIQATEGDLMQLASISAMIYILYVQSFACYYQGLNPVIYRGLNLATPLTFMKYRRDAEFDADFFGLQYLYKAGYDPEAYLQFIERLPPAGQPGKTVAKVFSPLPPPVERAKAIREEVNHLFPLGDSAKVSSSEFEAVKERLRTWKPKGSPAQDAPPGKPTLRKRAESPNL